MEMNLSDDFIRVLNEKFKKILKKYKRWISGKKYYKKNKQKINEKSKIYRQENKQKEEIRHKIYNLNNRQKISEKDKIYYKNNKQKINERTKKYQQTVKGKKVRRISDWKNIGLICDDYDALYEKVYNTTNCEECNVLLTIDSKKTKTTLCMDHDHSTGLFRNVLCLSCNIKRK
jgi:hypothetical protein